MPRSSAALLSAGVSGCRAGEKPYDAVDHQANPEVDKQSQIGKETIAVVLRRRGKVRHDQEIDPVPEQYRHQRDKKVAGKTHSLLRHLKPQCRFPMGMAFSYIQRPC